MRWEIMLTSRSGELEEIVKVLLDAVRIRVFNSIDISLNLQFTKRNNVLLISFDLDTQVFKSIQSKLPKGIAITCLTPRDKDKESNAI